MSAHDAAEQIKRQSKLIARHMIDNGDAVKAITISELEDICNYVGECDE